MEFFTKKEVIKKIIIVILIVMSFNYIAPTISQANDDETFGGVLFRPISLLLCGISDVIIRSLQGIFTGDSAISYGGIDEIESDTYHIKYSPGIIFSGR